MSGLNQVQLIGHLGADPEMRNTTDGRPVANLRLATSESWRDKTTGERRERTEWHRVVIFNEGLAKVAEKFLKKGAKVFVQGKLQTRKWTAQDGTERWSTEVVLTGFQCSLLMLDRAQRGPPSEDDDGETKSRPAAGVGKRNDMDDEIPF